MNILMIVTSHDQLGNTERKTGLWLEELSTPYEEFIQSAHKVDIASIKGGDAPIDPESLKLAPPSAAAFLKDPESMAKIHSTQSVDSLLDQGAEYEAYFVVGGHGIMWDAPDNPALQRMLGEAFERGKTIAAVCHGPAALVNVRLNNGDFLVKGRHVNSFTDDEERDLKLDTVVPFLLESRLRERGALFEKAAPGQAKIALDMGAGTLVTGQNPASAMGVAREVLRVMTLQITSVGT